jgi:hypothetical protein
MAEKRMPAAERRRENTGSSAPLLRTAATTSSARPASGCSGSSTARLAPATRRRRFQHLVLNGHASQDASAGNTALINALRNGGDLLNMFDDFPTLADPRHADAYSPLWDAQLGLWTPKAVRAGLNTRQIDENQVFNLAATRPDLLTGANPATGQPTPYGSVGVDINCAVIGYTAQAPTANLAAPVPDSHFPPR